MNSKLQSVKVDGIAGLVFHASGLCTTFDLRQTKLQPRVGAM